MLHCCLLMVDLKIFKLNLLSSAGTLESNHGREQVTAQSCSWGSWLLVSSASPGWLLCQRNPRPSTGLTTRLLLLNLAWWMNLRRRSVSVSALWRFKRGMSLVLRGTHQNWQRRLVLAGRCPRFTPCSVTNLEVTSAPFFRRKHVALYSEKAGERELNKLFWPWECIRAVTLLKQMFKAFL